MAGAAKYQPYPAYKPSGVEWLGDIPEGWEASKIKYETDFQVGWTPPTKTDENFLGLNLWANISDLGAYTITDTAKKISDLAAAKASMSITPRGSLLYSFKLSVGTVSFAGTDMFTNEAIASFLPSSSIPLAYLYYALPIFVIQNASTNIYGARILNQELIRGAVIATPPFGTATKIAAFLDYETAKIDALIAKQERLIALLEEKRQAVISHAVTKGLDPTAPMRPSGIDWLGDVPAHWETTRIKFEVSDISDCLHTTPTYDGDLLYPAIRTADVSPGKLDLVNARRVSEEIYRERTVRIKPRVGDILYSREGERFGMAALVPENTELCLGQRMMMFRTIDELESRFFMWSLNGAAILNQVLVQVSGSTSPHINISDIKNFAMTLPPLTEQVKISDHIDEMIGKCDQIKNAAQSAITLLKERRTALISAAVTGKIDLRGWEAPSDAQDSIQGKEVLA